MRLKNDYDTTSCIRADALGLTNSVLLAHPRSDSSSGHAQHAVMHITSLPLTNTCTNTCARKYMICSRMLPMPATESPCADSSHSRSISRHTNRCSRNQPFTHASPYYRIHVKSAMYASYLVHVIQQACDCGNVTLLALHLVSPWLVGCSTRPVVLPS